MPIHQLKLIQCKQIADATLLFDFEKPDGFSYQAGQYGGFTLINPTDTDSKGNTRRFSLVSSPDDDVLQIAMRIQTSAFKRILKDLPPGSLVKFAGPTGNFVLHEDASVPAVLIAGGIGITPFYSMIKQASTRQHSRPITLFYGNQSIAETAFLTELHHYQTINPHFTFIPTLANPDANWKGETGFISYEMIKKHVPELNQPIYYICGSPVMVNALRETLNELDIPESNIKVEDFPGY